MGRGPTGPQGGGEAPEQWVVETLGPLHPPQMWEDFRPDAGGSWGLCPGSQAPSPRPAVALVSQPRLPLFHHLFHQPWRGAASSPRNTPCPQPCP